MKKNKYAAVKVKRTVGKHVYEFDSTAEGRRFDYLYIKLKAGEISDLIVQPEFTLTKPFELGCNFNKSGRTIMGGLKYTPDFKYKKDGLTYVDEVKGMVTPSYRIRLKLFLSDAYKHDVHVFNEIIKDEINTYYLMGGRPIQGG